MIDKTVPFVSVIFILINNVCTAPAAANMNDSISEEMSLNSTEISLKDMTTVSPIPEPNLDLNDTGHDVTMTNPEPAFSDKERLIATPSLPKNTLKARKNKNDLFFCCTEDNLEPVTVPSRRGKERERNTKPPFLKRGKYPESEEPVIERRPALLLRFFPDGTAVLISKFQLHLHVKPKQIKFEPDDTSKEDELDFNPGLILNDGKSYEVTYKRLEAIPSSREQNLFDLVESEEKESYREDVDPRDHDFITTPLTPTSGPKLMSINSKPFPLQESTTETSTNVPEDNTKKTTINDESRNNKSDKLSPTVGDSPFFIMTSEEMSSLQHQYDPALASPLKATTVNSLNKQSPNETFVHSTTTHIPTTTTSTPETTITTESSNKVTEAPFTSTTKCLSFRNQLSLALSTEDNIDNSLLKRHIFPTQDCNNPESEISKSLAKLLFPDSTTKSTPTSLPIITRSTPEPITTPNYPRSNLVPYLASQYSNHPSKPDVVVVTSLPVLIDLKSTRNQPVTDVPTWKEVTVGVVRDHQGQPLKPRYNNWTAHLRGLRKKTDNKFWHDFTTPKPEIRPQSREPLQQGFQQSPSQINRAFWTDLQRQNHMTGANNKERMGAQLYRTNPPRNYPAQNENDFQYWRNRVHNAENRWNANTNSNMPNYSTSNAHRGSSHHGYDNRENRPWNKGVSPQNRRW